MCKKYDEVLIYKKSLRNPTNFNVKIAFKIVCEECGQCTAKERKKEKKHYLKVNKMLERN